MEFSPGHPWQWRFSAAAMGVWLQKRGILRRLVPRDAHLGLVERHGEILIEAMRILAYAAEQEGMHLEPSELLWECFEAKNSTDEYGGFSPMQGHAGRNSSWDVPLNPDDEELGGVFGRAFR